MRKCSRTPQPVELAERGPAVTEAYVRRRQAGRAATFDFPKDLRQILRAALSLMTDTRCAYCDGDLRNATASEEIDHFRPKSRPEFYALVCAWSNLFLVCRPCNLAKGDHWNEQAPFLNPDAPDFEFERYFVYNFEQDRLDPRPAATDADRARAEATIRGFGLNSEKQRSSRRRERQRLVRPDYDLRDAQYRYLIAAVRG